MTRFRPSSRAMLVALILATAGAGGATPAHAFIFGSSIVFDPSNYAENVLQAARTLEQINNQIRSLQNQGQMLINQARNLASLPYSSLRQLDQSLARTQQLLGQAQRIAFDVEKIDKIFSDQYAGMDLSMSDRQLVELARARWENTLGALKDAMHVQAGVVGNIEIQRSELAKLLDASQGAVGALAATQAGNQILALQVQQLADLTALLAASGRAEALSGAEQAAAAEQGRELRRRFLEPGTGYQPGSARMFPGDN